MNQELKPFRGISKYGYKNMNDQVVIQSKYDEAFSFNDGIAIIRSGCYWGHIDVQGKETFPAKDVPLDHEEMIPKELFSELVQQEEGIEYNNRYSRSGANIQEESAGFRYGDGVGSTVTNDVGVIQKHWGGAFVKVYFNSGRTVIVNYRDKKAYGYSELRENRDKKMILQSYVATESSAHQMIVRWFECLLKVSLSGDTDFSLTYAIPVLQNLLSLPNDRFAHAVKRNLNHTNALSATSKPEQHVIKIIVDWQQNWKGKLEYKINYDLESTAFPGLASVQVMYNDEYTEPTAFFSIYSPGNEGWSDGTWELWNKTQS
jgi:hypothetical protein